MTKDTKPSPVLVVPCSPFTIIGFDDDDKYEASLDEINHSTYDYVRFCRTTTSIDAEFGTNFGAILSYTGCLLYPLVTGMTKKLALEATNKILFRLFVGGIHFNAPKPRDVGHGLIYSTGYFRCIGGASGENYSFISALQSKMTGQDRNPILHKPRFYNKDKIYNTYWVGRKLTNELKEFNASIFMNSINAFFEYEYDSSLVFAWCFIEQMIDVIWISKIIDPNDKIFKRNSFLKNRSLSSAYKCEILFQKGIINDDTYDDLNFARDQRNKLIHTARPPEFSACRRALVGCIKMLGIVCPQIQGSKEFESMIQIFDRHHDLDNMKSTQKIGNPTMWREMLAIPGDEKWGDKEFPRYPEIELVSMKQELKKGV